MLNYYEKVYSTGFSDIFRDPFNYNKTVEIFWNGEKVFREIGKEDIKLPF